MDVAAIRQAGVVLPTVRQHAATLHPARQSPLTPSQTQWATTALSAAIADAERAASLLGSIELPRDAVRAMEDAARLLRQAAPSDPRLVPALEALRSASSTASDALETRIATLAPDDARALMRSILETPTDSLTRGDWQTITTLLVADRNGLVQRGPRKFSREPLFEGFAASNAVRPASEHDSIVATHRYLDAWRAAEFGPPIPTEQHAQVVRDIVAKDPADVSRDEWRTLGQILDAPADTSPLRGPRTIDDTPFARVAWTLAIEPGERARLPSSAQRERFLAAWRMADLPHAQRADILRGHMSHNPSDLTRDQWKQVQEVLDAGVDPSLLAGPIALEDAAPLARIAVAGLDELTRGVGIYAHAGDRYFDAWKGTAIPVAQRAGVVRAIVEKEPAQITSTEWRTLGTLLDMPAGSGVPDGPRKLDGAFAFARIAHANARDPAANLIDTERYLAAWRGSDIPTDQRDAIARAIIAKDREQITTDEWRTLGTLLDLDRDAHVLSGPLSLETEAPIANHVWRLALGEAPDSTSNRSLDTYLDAWRFAADQPEHRRELVLEQVMRRPSELAPQDWRRIWLLLEVDPTLGPPSIDERALTRWTRTLANGREVKPEDVPRLEQDFTAMRLRLDPGYRARLDQAFEDVAAGASTADARRLVLADLASIEEKTARLSSDERMRFAQLVADSDLVATTTGTGTMLRLVRPSMDRYAGLGDGLDAIRRQTLTFIDQNLQRLSGVRPEGAVAGFQNHAEYADVGRIRANLALLESVLATHSADPGDVIVW